VAACERAWLTAALHTLAAAGLPVRRIVPEYNPQMLAQTVFVSGDVDKPWVAGLTHSDGVDGAVSADMLVCGLGPVALERLHHAQAELRPGAVVMAEPPVVALAERLFKQAVTLQPRSERLVLAAQSNWNLAQFDLANLGRDRRWAGRRLVLKAFLYAPQWRPARWALLATLLFNLIGLNAQALREQASLQSKRQAVAAVLTTTFPKIPAVVDAPVQMAREVADLQRRSGQASATDMEQLLAQFGQAVPDSYSLTAIDFDASQLRLKGVGAVDAPSLTAKFQAAGLSASAEGEQWLISTGAKP
jgi:general secretion pathway protein L